MGSFFTNVHAQLPKGMPSEAALAKLSVAVRRLATTDATLVEAADGEPADRTVLLVARGEWIAIYDEAAESQAPSSLESLGAAASLALESPAFSTLVHDGDVLELRLFERGERVDVYNSAPAYFGKITAAQKAAQAGRNEGGRSKGLRIEVGGSAIDGGLVLPERVQLAFRADGHHAYVEAPVSRAGAAYAATFDEFTVPAAPAGGQEAFIEAARKGARSVIDLQWRSVVYANVFGRALVPGAGDVAIAFAPLDAPAMGQVIDARVRVAPAPRRPLRATLTEYGSALRDLEQPRSVFALAVLSMPQAEAAPIAAEILLRIAELFPETGSFSWGSYRGTVDEPLKPRSGTTKAARFFRGASWEKVCGFFAEDNHVSAWREAGDLPTSRTQDGFAFGIGILRNERAGNPELPVLAFSVDLAGRAEDDAARVLEVVKAAIDEVVLRARAPQALVARWVSPWGCDATPYEYACGIHGQCTLARSWALRFLRGVSADAMWVGPALLARIDRAALARVATLTPVADTLRVELSTAATLDDLERALAPILAGETDWRDGIDWLYGRRDRPAGDGGLTAPAAPSRS